MAKKNQTVFKISPFLSVLKISHRHINKITLQFTLVIDEKNEHQYLKKLKILCLGHFGIFWFSQFHGIL